MAVEALPAHWHGDVHSVQFYEEDGYLLDGLARFVGGSLGAGDSAVVIATEPHRAELDARLHELGIDVGRATSAGRLIELDAHETLARFMVDGRPDPSLFSLLVGKVLDRARDAAAEGHVAAFGEMVALLWAEGKMDAAIELEELWNHLALSHEFRLQCAYPMSLFSRESDATRLARICAEHSMVIPGESYATLADGDARTRAIAVLQQKARALETEIEERKAIEASLQTREIELRDAIAARDEFLAVAAHELKTPLTGLNLAAQVVLRRLESGVRDPAMISPLMERLGAQTSKVAQLVDQLLDISRLQRGQLLPEFLEVDLVQLAQSVVDVARGNASNHTLRLIAGEPITIEADGLRIEQVLANLIDNAVKYSPDGGCVEVGLSAPDDEIVQISVRDHGIGIQPEHRDRVFEPFYRIPLSNQPTGMGLGLHISRQIIELHGGTMHVETPDGGGSRFVVSLPRRRVRDLVAILS